MSGTIEEINEGLSSEPGLLNKSPEDKGKVQVVSVTAVLYFGKVGSAKFVFPTTLR